MSNTMTGDQILASFLRAMRASDEEDATGKIEGFERSWFRLQMFVGELGREFDGVAPELHNQLVAYCQRVNDGDNSLRDACRLAEGGKQ